MPRKKAVRKKPDIEHQEILAETGRRSYEMLRLKRVKYAQNPYTFLDLRIYQRGWDAASDDDVYHPTKERVVELEDLAERQVPHQARRLYNS